MLAAVSKLLGKRLIGASDGFDLHSANVEVMLAVNALVTKLMIKGLREKVRRGMRRAASRGTVIGKLPMPFTRCLLHDADGQVVLGGDGLPIHSICIDPNTRESGLMLFELYTQRLWSPPECRCKGSRGCWGNPTA